MSCSEAAPSPEKPSPATRYLASCPYGLGRSYLTSLLSYMPSLACLPVMRFGDLWLLRGMYGWLLAGLAQPNEQILNFLLLASHTATGMDNHCGYVLSCNACLPLLSDVMGKGSGNLLYSDVWLWREQGQSQQQWMAPRTEMPTMTLSCRNCRVCTCWSAGLPHAKSQWSLCPYPSQPFCSWHRQCQQDLITSRLHGAPAALFEWLH